MGKRYYLDTCILYSLLNRPDRHHKKVKAQFRRMLQDEDILIISQFVYLEFVQLSKRKAAEELIKTNTHITSIPRDFLKTTNSKIRNQLQVLNKFDIKIIYIPLSTNVTRTIEDLVNEIYPTIKTIKSVGKFVKIFGVLDMVHLISCELLKCEKLLTTDKDFTLPPINKWVAKNFEIQILK